MTNTGAKISFKARLSRPAAPTGASWTFLVLPKSASMKLPTRSMTAVEGTMNGYPAGGIARGEAENPGSLVPMHCKRAAKSPASIRRSSVCRERFEAARECRNLESLLPSRAASSRRKDLSNIFAGDDRKTARFAQIPRSLLDAAGEESL
jgi:Domain of unknown function (DUF1905)